MFDQSFSIRNFRSIYDTDRKNKGNIEHDYFLDAYIVRMKINFLRKYMKILEIKYKSKLINAKRFEARKLKFKKLIERRNEQYNELINTRIKEITCIVSKKNYLLPLEKLPQKIKEKDIFSIGKQVEDVFASKLIQYSLASLFSVKINDRDMIISRLSALVKDKSPKYIIRADIEGFYESIDHKKLLSILHSSPKLSITPRRILTQLIRRFKEMTGKDRGVPRGIGISAYLSEIYMNDIDNNIRALKDVIYYERYVDDLIIVFAPSQSKNIESYIKNVTKIIENKGLQLNNDKTVELDLYNQPNKEFDYLGYNFNVAGDKCKISLSNKKIEKLKARITKSFDEYNAMLHKTPRRAYSLLLLRLRFLTGNTRLYNSKAKAFVGIYCSNKFINDTKNLNGIDLFLKNKSESIKDQKLQKRINKLSFEKGFNDKVFRNFSINELSSISKVWKND